MQDPLAPLQYGIRPAGGAIERRFFHDFWRPLGDHGVSPVRFVGMGKGRAWPFSQAEWIERCLVNRALSPVRLQTGAGQHGPTGKSLSRAVDAPSKSHSVMKSAKAGVRSAIFQVSGQHGHGNHRVLCANGKVRVRGPVHPPHIVAPSTQGANSAAPKSNASLLVASPEATRRMRSKIRCPHS